MILLAKNVSAFHSLRPTCYTHQYPTELLTEMHEKLSQAVRLYDKLLTEHVSQPAWRAAAPDAVPAYQRSTFNPSYQVPPQPYNQWASEAQPAQQRISPPVQTSVHHTAQSYLTPPVLNVHSGYVTSPNAEHQSLQGSMQSPPVQVYQPQHYHVQQHPVEVPQQTPQYDTASAGLPLAPFRASTAAVPAPVHGSSPPMVAETPASLPVGAPQVTQTSLPPPPPLSHQNSVYAASPSHAPAVSSVLPATHSADQLQRLEQVSVPVQLPDFPSVPASIPSPQAYPGYPMGAAVEAERKEALLIDL